MGSELARAHVVGFQVEVGNGHNEQQQWQATKEPPCLTLSGPCQVNCVISCFENKEPGQV